MKKILGFFIFAAAAAHAQTPIYNGLELKSGAINFSDAGKTQPVRSGTLASRPTSCTASKEMYLATDPAVAGQALYICNAAGNGWALAGDGNTGGGGGSVTIQDEGVGLTQRSIVNFTGAGVTCTDNAGNSRTDCTIAGGGGGGLAVPGGNGLVVHSGSGNAVNRTVAGTTGEVTVANGDGVSGNPTIALAPAFDISGKTSTKSVKTGTTPPATCSAGELFIDTDAPLTSQFLVCSAGNIWTAQGATGGGGTAAEFIPWQPFASVAAGATRYVNMGVMASTEPLSGRNVMTAGNLVEFRLNATGTQAADGTLTCTVRKSVSGVAYADTAAAIVVSNSDGVAPRKSWTGSVAVNAGDLLSVACVNASGSSSVSIGSVVLKVQ